MKDYQDRERRRDAIAEYATVRDVAAASIDRSFQSAERMEAVAWAEANGLDAKWVDRMLTSFQKKSAIRNMGFDPEQPKHKPARLKTVALDGGFQTDGLGAALSETGFDARKGPCVLCFQAARRGAQRPKGETGHLH